MLFQHSVDLWFLLKLWLYVGPSCEDVSTLHLAATCFLSVIIPFPCFIFTDHVLGKGGSGENFSSLMPSVSFCHQFHSTLIHAGTMEMTFMSVWTDVLSTFIWHTNIFFTFPACLLDMRKVKWFTFRHNSFYLHSSLPYYLLFLSE